MTLPAAISPQHLRRCRTKHAQSDGYGRHRHLYLHEPMRSLAASVSAELGRPATLFDYGCGKGRFMDEMRRLGVFGEIAGYDPGVETFAALPDRQYDIVTCLDVLDAAERFVDGVIADVARITAHTAVFDCLTKPTKKSGFKPHPAFYWVQLVAKTMRAEKTEMHFLGLADFERAVIFARPSS